MREQLIDAGCRTLDAVLFTHAHADHVPGIDDLRAFNYRMGRVIDAWGTRETLPAIRQRFGYAFDLLPEDAEMYRPPLRAHDRDGPFPKAGIEVTPNHQNSHVS